MVGVGTGDGAGAGSVVVGVDVVVVVVVVVVVGSVVVVDSVVDVCAAAGEMADKEKRATATQASPPIRATRGVRRAGESTLATLDRPFLRNRPIQC